MKALQSFQEEKFNKNKTKSQIAMERAINLKKLQGNQISKVFTKKYLMINSNENIKRENFSEN